MNTKSMRKTLSLLLCLVLVLGMLPVGTLATEAEPLQVVATPDEASSMTVYVNGVDVKDIDAEDDTISWNEETNTLTLNNASILNENGNYKGSGIYAVGSDTLILELVGDNTVEGKFNGQIQTENGWYKNVDDIFANAAISTVGDLVIRGEGSLTATDLEYIPDENSGGIPGRSAGIYAGGELTIEGGNITAVSQTACNRYIGSSGIISGDYDSIGSMTVSGGNVSGTGLSSGIASVGDITVSGGNVNATGTDKDACGMNLFQVEDAPLLPSLRISGGRVELQGSSKATDGLLDCGGYDYYMWRDVKDGTPQYTSVPAMQGMMGMSSYLLIEPSAYRPVPPTPENRYTLSAEALSGEEYGALPEGVTTEVHWYTQSSRYVTAQDAPMFQVCTYEESTGLWTFPSMNDADATPTMAFAAEPGDTVTITLTEASSGLFLAACEATNEAAIFSEVAPGVYSHTITEDNINSDSGLFLFIVLVGAESGCNGTVTVTSLESASTAAEDANQFSSDTAGTYVGQITVSENGTPVGTLRSKAFDYLPVNTVTFDANGGSCETATVQTQEGTHTLAQLPEATLTGYSLKGWFDAQGNKITTDTVIMEDITLTAQWEINEYTLTVQGMDGVIYEAPVPYGSDLAAIISGLEIGKVTTADGTYTFNGSFDVQVPATMPAEALTLTAQYDFTPKGELVYENGAWYYYVDGKITYGGLIKLDGNYYYIRTNGQAVTGRTYWTTKTNGLLPAANYYFDETGKLREKNGLVAENGGLYYYVDGKLNYAGLIEIDGAYYYIRSNGQAVTGRSYWVTKTNGLKDAASYTFGADGKLVLGGSFVREADGIYYYLNGKRNYAGLILEDGSYYYVRSNGQLVTGRSYWITKTNGLLDAANYEFDENGVMTNAPV